MQGCKVINKEQGRKRGKSISSEIILCSFFMALNQPQLYTANSGFQPSVFKYADPVADLLDRWGVFRARLFRESCVFHRGNYVKDLSRLGRELSKVIIVDNSPASYIFHPENAVSTLVPALTRSFVTLVHSQTFSKCIFQIKNINISCFCVFLGCR